MKVNYFQSLYNKKKNACKERCWLCYDNGPKCQCSLLLRLWNQSNIINDTEITVMILI